MSPVAPVNIAAFHCRAGYLTNLKQGLGQGMSVISLRYPPPALPGDNNSLTVPAK
jgi:hypothetical protein